MEKVAVNQFVKRQVEGSGKTFSRTLSFEEIAKYAETVSYTHLTLPTKA